MAVEWTYDGVSDVEDGVSWTYEGVVERELVVGGATAVGITSIACATTVGSVVLERLRQLGITNVACASAITSALITRLRQLDMTSVTCATAITASTLLVKRLWEISVANIFCASQITDFALARFGHPVGISSMSVASSVSTPQIAIGAYSYRQRGVLLGVYNSAYIVQ